MIRWFFVVIFAFLLMTIGWANSLGILYICGGCLWLYNRVREALDAARHSEFVANARRKLAP